MGLPFDETGTGSSSRPRDSEIKTSCSDANISRDKHHTHAACHRARIDRVESRVIFVSRALYFYGPLLDSGVSRSNGSD
jgi:hypothetical protein